MNLDAETVIARYQQELAQAQYRAIVAETHAATLQTRIDELEAGKPADE